MYPRAGEYLVSIHYVNGAPTVHKGPNGHIVAVGWEIDIWQLNFTTVDILGDGGNTLRAELRGLRHLL